MSSGNRFSSDQKQGVSEELRAAGAESEGVGKPPPRGEGFGYLCRLAAGQACTNGLPRPFSRTV